MNSPKSSPNPVTPSPAPVVLRVRGIGNLTSFKNRKRIAGKNLITEPSVKRRQIALRDVIVCEYTRALATVVAETLMVSQPVSSMPLFLPDDCWTVVPELIVTGQLVPKGDEGCDVTIELLP